MKVFELIITDETEGIDAISLVDRPAIEENFIALSADAPYKFEEVSKGIVTGPALIPNKKIYRKDDKGMEYYVYFTEETVEKAALLFFKNGNQNNATVQHKSDVDGVTTFESWIIQDPEKDKAKALGMDLPKGTWMISQKVDNPEVLAKVKDGTYRGFSIEGYFADKLQKEEPSEDELMLEAIKEILMASYTDYPKAAQENAKIALRYAEENGWGDCGTPVGKQRANQLANGEPISEETIARMAAFERHRQNSDKELGDGCGRLMWLAWGGDEGIEWAQRKLEQIRNEK